MPHNANSIRRHLAYEPDRLSWNWWFDKASSSISNDRLHL